MCERLTVEQHTGGEEHTRVGSEPVAGVAAQVNLGDGDRVVSADAVEHGFGMLAQVAVGLGEQGDGGHALRPAWRSASSWSTGTYIVWSGAPP